MTEEEYRVSIGAYLLGALEPGEALEVQAHLLDCAECQREYLELTEVLPALAALPPDLGAAGLDDLDLDLDLDPEVAGHGTGGHHGPTERESSERDTHRRADADLETVADLVLHRTLRQIRAERRARRPRLLIGAGVAAAVIAAVPLGMATVRGGSTSPAPTQAIQDTSTGVPGVRTETGTNAATRVALTATLSRDGATTRIEGQLTGARPGMVCRLMASTAAGAPRLAAHASVPAPPPGGVTSAWMSGSVNVPIDQITTLYVLTGKGEVLVTIRL